MFYFTIVMDQETHDDYKSSEQDKSATFSYTERLNNILDIRLGKDHVSR